MFITIYATCLCDSKVYGKMIRNGEVDNEVTWSEQGTQEEFCQWNEWLKTKNAQLWN